MLSEQSILEFMRNFGEFNSFDAAVSDAGSLR